MSTTLMWKPVSKIKGDLPRALKFAISRKLWGTDGSCGGSATLKHKDINYLEGLRDAGIAGADDLIELIHKYDEVIVWHQG